MLFLPNVPRFFSSRWRRARVQSLQLAVEVCGKYKIFVVLAVAGIKFPEIIKSCVKNDIAIEGFDYPSDGPVLTLGGLAVGAGISIIVAIGSSLVGPSSI